MSRARIVPIAVLGIVVWACVGLCQLDDRSCPGDSVRTSIDGSSHQVVSGWREGMPEPDGPDGSEPVPLSSIYERFIDSLDQSDDIKQRYRTFLIDALSEQERARVIDEEYRSRVEAYLEIERSRFDLSWYRTRARMIDDGPLDGHLELGKREAWILAPHLCLTVRNAILCDPVFREDMHPDARAELLAAMAAQADFAKSLLSESFAHDTVRDPVRDALLETVLSESRQDALRTIESVMTHRFFAPARRSLDARQLNEIRGSVYRALAGIVNDAEETGAARAERFLETQRSPIFQRKIDVESVDYRSMSESQTEMILERLRAVPRQPNYDDWAKVLGTLPVEERVHLKYQYEMTRKLMSRIAVEIMRQMLGSGGGFDPAADTVFCLPGFPRPTQYEFVYTGVTAQVLLVDPRFKTLLDVDYDPAFDEHLPGLHIPFRPNTEW